jgi:hypothetical protein
MHSIARSEVSHRLSYPDTSMTKQHNLIPLNASNLQKTAKLIKEHVFARLGKHNPLLRLFWKQSNYLSERPNFMKALEQFLPFEIINDFL